MRGRGCLHLAGQGGSWRINDIKGQSSQRLEVLVPTELWPDGTGPRGGEFPQGPSAVRRVCPGWKQRTPNHTLPTGSCPWPGWRSSVSSSGVMVSIIVVNTSSLNISHLTCKPFGLGTHLRLWAGKSELHRKIPLLRAKEKTCCLGL